MNDLVYVTREDIINIIMMANQAGMRGEYVYALTIVKSTSAASNLNASIGIDSHGLESGSKSEPIPLISIFYE